MKRPAKSKAAPHSALEVTQCLRRVLRDPRALIKMSLCRQLNASSPDAVQTILASDPQLRSAVRAAVELLYALRRLVLILEWPCFQAENFHLSSTAATNRYARRARVSRSTLYRWRTLFDQHGILGLAPNWRGGRPGRAALAERVIQRDIAKSFRVDGLYGVYRLFRRRLKILGRPLPRLEALREMSQISGGSSHVGTKVLRRSSDRTTKVPLKALCAVKPVPSSIEAVG